jgi:16S rRNA (guanine966-N2)-methyltransferase
MRIVAGRHRGRHIEAPEGLAVRPTADRTREAMFNILERGKLPWPEAFADTGNPLTCARVLDAFAGTGALGLEAASRGAAHVTFMENQAVAIAACRDNIRALGEESRCEVVTYDVLHPPHAAMPCDLVLMDPPYGQGLAAPALAALRETGWIAPGTLVVIELMAKEDFAAPGGFATVDTRKYGKARLEFLRAEG